MPPVERTSEEITAALVEVVIGKERWWEAPPLPAAAQPAQPTAQPSQAAAAAGRFPGRSLLAALYRSLFGAELPGLEGEAKQQPEGLNGSTRVRRAAGRRGGLAFSTQGGSGSASFWSALKPEPAPKPAPKPAAAAAPQPYPAVTLAEALSQLQGWGGRTPPSLASLQAKAATQAASGNGRSNGNSNGSGAAKHQAAVAAVADALAPAVAAAAKQPLYGQSGATAFSTRGGSGVASFGANGASRTPTRG